MNNWQKVELLLLLFWVAALIYCTICHVNVPMAISTAFCGFVGAVAIKNSFPSK
jgi:hypothetical protein